MTNELKGALALAITALRARAADWRNVSSMYAPDRQHVPAERAAEADDAASQIEQFIALQKLHTTIHISGAMTSELIAQVCAAIRENFGRDVTLPANAAEQRAEKPEIQPAPWRVYRVNDCEWWIGRNPAEVRKMFVEAQGCSEEDCERYELLGEIRELTDEELDRLVFTDYERDAGDPMRKRTFREELERRIRLERPEFPQHFASTEI